VRGRKMRVSDRECHSHFPPHPSPLPQSGERGFLSGIQ
jgi:hypothetical protein